MKITDRVARIVNGDTTARQEVETALAKAKEAKGYHALLSLTADRALKRADEIDTRIASGESVGPLAGVPFVVKDNYLAFGAPTTAAAKILETSRLRSRQRLSINLRRRVPSVSARAILTLLPHGASTENSAYGVTKNAIDQTKVAGGSSGGSAVVTALDIVPFALGSDTGGSIRQPASFNGVYGYKPTYGTSSRYGVVAMASSTDTMGCFAKCAEDVALVTSIMAGRDEKDMTTLPDFFEPTTFVQAEATYWSRQRRNVR